MTDASLTHVLSQADMNRFAGLSAARHQRPSTGVRGSHHTDPAVAREAGLSGTVAQALHYCAYISQLLLEQHGERWLEGAELEMKFIRPVYADDAVEVKVSEPDAGADTVECRNQQRELVAIGNVRLGPQR